jgi:hypothetical protein
MKAQSPTRPHPRLYPRQYGSAVAAVGVGVSTYLHAAFGTQIQVLALGIQVSLLFGWLVRQRDLRQFTTHHNSPSSQTLERDSENRGMPGLLTVLTDLQTLVEMPDDLVRDCILTKLAGLDEEVRRLASGRIVFENTETWRTAYEKVLRAPGVTGYRSVSWAKTADYWQDRPGQQSIRLNYDLLDRGVGIERIVILGWNLWLPEIYLPGNSIRRWLDEQYYRGISLALVRESDLLNEPDLLRDFGIYGTRATGEQELDEESRTVRFELRFDEPGIRLAADRWERLKLYARPYSELLDQTAIGD